ncbi:MAG TPA: energy transducer TonB [Pyrinomonadaceae bacterium]
MPINQVNLTILFTLILLVTAHVTLAQGKKLKPEEAAKAVQLVHALETDPLSENAKKSRDWLTKTVFGADGLYVPQCKDLFDRADSKGKYAKALTLQVSVSFAAYTIEYPTDSAEDPETRMRAGVEGMLKAYDSILVSEPTARLQFLELLKAKRQTPEWNGLLREVMARCSPVPLSDRNYDVYSGQETVYAPIEVSTPVKVKSKPDPIYTDQAKANRTQGVVVLLAVFTKTGKVTNLKVLAGLPDGLTDGCVAAASKIRFEPAIRKGQPVSSLVRLEYYFGMA